MLCLGCNEYRDDNDCYQLDAGWFCADCVGFCCECKEAVSKEDAECIDGNYYCEDCFNDNFVHCEDCDEIIGRDESIYSELTSECYCESCYAERFDRCVCCDCEVTIRDCSRNDNGDHYCDSCYSENYYSCDSCGCEIPNDEAYCTDSGVYCSGCRRDDSDDSSEWNAKRFHRSGVAVKVGSTRKYGVELETSACPGSDDLQGKVYFECCEDGSISGMEFKSAVLADDNGLDAINEFCRYANNLDFEVDNKCGFHAHFDMSDESVEGMRSTAYAYYVTRDVWARFVGEQRRNYHYCCPTKWDVTDLNGITDKDEFERWAGRQDRRQWFNVAAYSRHETFEVRLHSATLEGDKVCNWVKAHTRFIDWAVGKTFAEINEVFSGSIDERFAALAEIWDDAELADYYRDRAGKFGYVFRACADKVEA